MNPRFERTARLVGEDGVARLDAASVMIVGLGGVGSYAFESVSRAGVGRLMLVDNDKRNLPGGTVTDGLAHEVVNG